MQVDVSLEADAVIRYLQANYVPIATLEVGAVEWMVYEYRPATDVVDAPSANIALTAS